MGLFKRKKPNSINNSGPGIITSLEDEKQNAEIIINNIDDGVVLIDNNNTIHVFNPGAAKMTKWSQQESKDLDYRSILRFADEKGKVLNDNEHPLSKAMITGEHLRDSNATLLDKQNKLLPVDITATPLKNQGDDIRGVALIMRDVEKQRKEEKKHADFISTASHEMRTPVAAIEGYLALALNDKVTKIDVNARSYLEKAHASTQHLGKLFQDLLTSAKAEDGRLTNHPAVVELVDFVEKLVDDLKFAAEKKGLLLELLMGSQNRTDQKTVDASKKVVKPVIYVFADPDRLREVLTNLFDNAVKYTETGRISIGLTSDKNIAQIHISDTGPGIPKEDMPHLFQKFYRVDNSTTRTIGGTGLGLFICRKIIELYHGKIWVESEPGKGSTFYINLPRLSSDKATELQKNQTDNRVVQPEQNV